MRRPGRRLTAEEAQVWAQVARTVTPLEKRRPAPAPAELVEAKAIAAPAAPPPKKVKGRVPPPLAPKPAPPKPAGPGALQLDGSWEKRIAKGTLAPDFSLDLHGSSLDQAYLRLMHGLTQAKSMGARVVLVVTGKPRPVDAMDRGTARGAIRAKIADWLAASEHAFDIVAVRGAHRRHGGQGALYVVLKKRR
ncbi:DNA-nicking Smr family endonuclease [Novosphingobium sp. PhB165]|uniref:Smr/MutS family protein n=1 Tax=Novosphingobium sp. PhB165 TaxID=2485105 RepID=UPI00104E1916|nr:Smr/MutS family protein [Novosphingobium sp. PhB165]TCM18967.1 DNA-nicking Smr family endonuclease [Novosphingobium sp. PhB165]